ncbi:MAG: TlpA family protein disulfide reductase [Marinomonas sp.]
MYRLPFRHFLLALGLSVTLTACDRAAEADAQQQESSGAAKSVLTGEIDRTFAGTAMPSAQLTHTDGSTLDLASLKGEPVLVNLWATWCAPCVLEMPMLDNLADELGGDVRVLTVSQDLTGEEAVAPFFAKYNFVNLQPWMDRQNVLGFGFGGDSLPTTVLYNAAGEEVFRVAGGYEWDSEEAQAQIKEALAD